MKQIQTTLKRHKKNDMVKHIDMGEVQEISHAEDACRVEHGTKHGSLIMHSERNVLGASDQATNVLQTCNQHALAIIEIIILL